MSTFPNMLGLTETERWLQYVLCSERGHQGSAMASFGNLDPSAPVWSYCHHCGTEFYTITTVELQERNQPLDPKENDEEPRLA